MDRGFAVLIMALVGGCIALQAPINAGLGKSTGNFAAATVSFAVGTVLLAAIVFASGKAGGLSNATDVQWYYLLGARPGQRDRCRRGRGRDGDRAAHHLGGARPDRVPRPRPRADFAQPGAWSAAAARGDLSDRSLGGGPANSGGAIRR